MAYKELLDKIRQRRARVAIIGMGYVGLPLMRTFALAGYRCLAFDTDAAKVKNLSQGKSYIKHIPSSALKDLRTKNRYLASRKPRDLRRCDVLIICVPTPLTSNREPDMSFVTSTAETIRMVLQPGQLVILESTTYPGTTSGLLKPILETNGLRAGRDFFLAYSPEREDPGRTDHDTSTIPKIVGGYNTTSGKLACALYGNAIKQVVPVSSCEVAEAAKILENVYRGVNIALVNELKVLLDKMGIDIWEVIDAASTKPFGFQPFYPGPGLGGHCIPIDPFYLTWKARQYGLSTRFIELAGEINTAMPEFVVSKVVAALNSRKKPVNGARILVLGLAYKSDVEDVRESPAIKLIELLKARGAKVDYNDPLVPKTHKMRQHDLRMTSKALSPKMLRAYDCVLIATAHSTYDFKMIGRHARLIVDTRNATRGLKGVSNKIIKA